MNNNTNKKKRKKRQQHTTTSVCKDREMTRNISIDQELYMSNKPTLVLNVSKFQQHDEVHRFKALAT